MFGSRAGWFCRSSIAVPDRADSHRRNHDFSGKTFCINVIGCIVIGAITVLAAKLSVPPRMILFLKVGVCGGFTTFSTFALESSDLIRDGHMGIALCYVLLSVLVGVLAIFAVEYLTVR